MCPARRFTLGSGKTDNFFNNSVAFIFSVRVYFYKSSLLFSLEVKTLMVTMSQQRQLKNR